MAKPRARRRGAPIDTSSAGTDSTLCSRSSSPAQTRSSPGSSPRLVSRLTISDLSLTGGTGGCPEAPRPPSLTATHWAEREPSGREPFRDGGRNGVAAPERVRAGNANDTAVRTGGRHPERVARALDDDG